MDEILKTLVDESLKAKEINNGYGLLIAFLLVGIFCLGAITFFILRAFIRSYLAAQTERSNSGKQILRELESIRREAVESEHRAEIFRQDQRNKIENLDRRLSLLE